MATLRRTEAKAFFANERTFLHWMNMSVTLGSISAALLGEMLGGEGEERREKERGREKAREGERKKKRKQTHLSTSAGKKNISGVSGVAHKSWGKGYEHHAIAVRLMAALMMCLSIFMAGYAAHMFKVRGDMLM